MKITVCFKVLPNPDRVIEEDWDHFSPNTDIGYAGLDFNCFDEAALEIALKLKEKMAEQGTEVLCSALTVSDCLPESFQQRLYSVGFDSVRRIPLQNREFCPEKIGALLAKEAVGSDLILCGREAGMGETGMVPYVLAESLGIPLVADIRSADWMEKLTVRCYDHRGLTEKNLGLPAVVTVGNSPEVLRMATLRQRMKFKDCKETVCPIEEQWEPEAPVLQRPETCRDCRMLDPLQEDSFLLIRQLLQKAASRGSLSAEKTQIPTGKGLTCFPDTQGGRRAAVRKASTESLPCFFGGQVTALTEKTVTLEKRACGSNLLWKKPLSLPAVITCPDMEEEAQVPSPAVEEERLLEPAAKKSLSQAALVLVCGNGMGSAAACEAVRDFAEKIGGSFGLTRPAAMNGWGDVGEMVGQSGSILGAEACLVLGVAGAGPFLRGCEKCHRVIAVNRDPHALIFNHADYGIVMDAGEFMKKLQEVMP